MPEPITPTPQNWTRDGHWIGEGAPPGSDPARPALVARCGGPAMCPDCRADLEERERLTMPDPDTTPTGDADIDDQLAETVAFGRKSAHALTLNADGWTAWSDRLADLLDAMPAGFPVAEYLADDGMPCALPFNLADRITVAEIDRQLRAVLSYGDAVAATFARLARQVTAKTTETVTIVSTAAVTS